jgi:hypothetical protein
MSHARAAQEERQEMPRRAATVGRHNREHETMSNATATPLVTHREFKLLLKLVTFPNRRALLEFNELLVGSAAKLGVHYEPVEAIDSQLRIVQFYDTKAQDLRKNKLIFRIRQIRQGGWPDESWELTFKCRAPEYDKAAGFDTNTTFAQLQKKKFKEELIRGEQPGTMRSIFSNNVIVESPQINLEFPLAKLAEALPHLKSLGLELDQPLAIVASAKVFEIQATLGNSRSVTASRLTLRLPCGCGLSQTRSNRWWQSSASRPMCSRSRATGSRAKKNRRKRRPTTSSRRSSYRLGIGLRTERRRPR